jgi:hypothetical protein
MKLTLLIIISLLMLPFIIAGMICFIIPYVVISSIPTNDSDIALCGGVDIRKQLPAGCK